MLPPREKATLAIIPLIFALAACGLRLAVAMATAPAHLRLRSRIARRVLGARAALRRGRRSRSPSRATT